MTDARCYDQMGPRTSRRTGPARDGVMIWCQPRIFPCRWSSHPDQHMAPPGHRLSARLAGRRAGADLAATFPEVCVVHVRNIARLPDAARDALAAAGLTGWACTSNRRRGDAARL